MVNITFVERGYPVVSAKFMAEDDRLGSGDSIESSKALKALERAQNKRVSI